MKSPASPAQAPDNSSIRAASAPALRPPGSVRSAAPSAPPRAIAMPHAPASLSSTATVQPTSYQSGLRHRVYTSLMRPKLLMGCELELAKVFITATVLCFMLAIIKFSLGWLALSLLFGGPMMWTIRMLSQVDEDY